MSRSVLDQYRVVRKRLNAIQINGLFGHLNLSFGKYDRAGFFLCKFLEHLGALVPFLETSRESWILQNSLPRAVHFGDFTLLKLRMPRQDRVLQFDLRSSLFAGLAVFGYPSFRGVSHDSLQNWRLRRDNFGCLLAGVFATLDQAFEERASVFSDAPYFVSVGFPS